MEKFAIQFGRYTLHEKIAVGGMAEIFKASLRGVGDFQKTLVIKRILPFYSQREDFINMLVDEAKLLVHLNHPNIVQIYELGCVDEVYYIAMEFVDGWDLRKVLRRLQELKLQLPQDVAISVMLETLQGLNYAHNRQVPGMGDLRIVHRDVSPQNILLSRHGEVKVTDFGIAKAANRTTETQTNILKGKFAYMSPEQALGRPLDARSDQFAWGIVLYELLFNKKLFSADNDIKILNQIRRGEVNLAPEDCKKLLPGVEKILRKVLAKKPEDRYENANELSHDLEATLPERRRLNSEELAEYFNELLKDSESSEISDKKPATLSKNLNEENILLSNSRYGTLASRKKIVPKASSRPRFLSYSIAFFLLVISSIALFLAAQKFYFGRSSDLPKPQTASFDTSKQDPLWKSIQAVNQWPAEILTVAMGPFASWKTLQSYAPIKTKIIVSPEQGNIFLKYPGGEKKGEGQLETPPLPPGTKVNVSANLKGYDPKYLELTLSPKKTQASYQLNLQKIEPKFGSIQVNARPWGKVFMSGYIGGQATPVGRGKIPVGNHTVTVKSPDGSKSASARVRIRPNSTSRCMAQFGAKASMSCN
ncbi:MAG: serine/threonine protein kinase [Deltaproteobacteria bacterium]|nr:serine/threonine protein kinase [Deltaproteobacteria bacterium]